MIRSDRKFKETCELIKDRIANDFDRAEEHAHFSITCDLYILNSTWDYEAYKKEAHDMSELKRMLEMIGEWNKELRSSATVPWACSRSTPSD